MVDDGVKAILPTRLAFGKKREKRNKFVNHTKELARE